MEDKKCYLYAPPRPQPGRAPKRRRLVNTGQPTTWELREHAFHEAWAQQEHQIQGAIDDADRSTLEKIAAFVSGVVPGPRRDRPPIPTGLVITGPSIASHGPFFRRVSDKIIADTKSIFVPLNSAECPNLKTLLKTLIRKATSGLPIDEDDDELPPSGAHKTGSKPLDYDLCLLLDWYSKTPVDKITIAIQDSEGFDDSIIVETIELLSSWSDRLPFVLLFGIATSADRFQDRLTGSAILSLEGEQFVVEQAEESLEKIFRATVEGPHVSLRVGPNLCRLLLDRHSDHSQSTQDFYDSLKYAYLCHFYANPMSVFLNRSLEFDQINHSAFEALRTLPSFRNYVEALLEDGSTDEIHSLLDSDQFLFANIKQHLELGQTALSRLTSAIAVVVILRNAMWKTQQVRYSSLYIRSASGDLYGSPLTRETILMVRKASSDTFSHVLATLASLRHSGLPMDIKEYQQALADLTEHSTTSAPLKSHYDVQSNTLRTTLVAQKVDLSKHKSTLSKQDAAYSDLIGRFHDELEAYLTEALIDPHSLYLSEILLYDLKSPHNEVFAPKPRFAMERALSSPHDYLNCSCCAESKAEGEHQLSASQPPSTILYQLYLESGAMLNVNDLWLAFNAITGGEDNQSEDVTTSLFQRSLAEFKYFGLVKPSRKKVDHVSKMMWKGL
ncbi:uncharacterized protein BDZ99DRAFT_447958 [Mytilinidion resinicola]|uniref:Origin recognition complex subunit n=1 Tax=Mytilinidion resinicola TaxID=574789 RepID=A0A6A6YCQ3_9PEZI|nr:uncharacterized protein BDZ99DRAFT_447958 [Mytilinidion resinicola]KAF2806592.1 hypothetical protein BDZ99DRAFT_447958 [Mytilinidion resinicola]